MISKLGGCLNVLNVESWLWLSINLSDVECKMPQEWKHCLC